MSFFRTIFGYFNPRYLLRSYVISAIFFAMIILVMSNSNKDLGTGFWLFMTLNALLFPFAKYLWDEGRSFLLGDNIFILPALFMLLVKYFINAILWSMAILLAPISILWIWTRTRRT